MMRSHYTDTAAEDVAADGAVGVKIRWLVDENTGAPNFAMRHVEIAPGGNTPLHEHAWEHEVFGLGGQGVVVGADGEQPFGAGDVVYMPPGEKHQFRNTGADPLTMICIVPHKKACAR